MTKEEIKNTESIGDGAYATFTGADFQIWCEREEGRHWVSMDIFAIEALYRFALSKLEGTERARIIERLKKSI